MRPECSLSISPCTFNGTTVTQVAPVLPVTFNVINALSFEVGYVGYPATNLVRRGSLLCKAELWQDDLSAEDA